MYRAAVRCSLPKQLLVCGNIHGVFQLFEALYIAYCKLVVFKATPKLSVFSMLCSLQSLFN